MVDPIQNALSISRPPVTGAPGLSPSLEGIPTPPLQTAAYLGIGIVGTTLLNIAARTALQEASARRWIRPELVRPLGVLGGTALNIGAMEGMYRVGLVPARPEWGMVFRATPHLGVLQFGIDLLMSQCGVANDGPFRTIATNGLMHGTVITAQLVPSESALHRAFLSSLGDGLQSEIALGGRVFLAGDGIAGGAGILGGVFQGLGSAGSIFLANEANNLVWSVWQTLADDPDTDLFMAANDQNLVDASGAARPFLPLLRTFQGIAGDGNSIYSAAQDRIQTWSNQANQLPTEILSLAMRSLRLELGPVSTLSHTQLRQRIVEAFQTGHPSQIDSDSLLRDIGRFYEIHLQGLENLYETIGFIEPSVHGAQLTRETREIYHTISARGHVTDPHHFQRTIRLLLENNTAERHENLVTLIANLQRDLRRSFGDSQDHYRNQLQSLRLLRRNGQGRFERLSIPEAEKTAEQQLFEQNDEPAINDALDHIRIQIETLGILGEHPEWLGRCVLAPHSEGS